MAGTAVRFANPYQNYSASTIFDVDQATKTLKPFASGNAYTEAGYQFGQERLVNDPNEFAGYAIGPIINDRAAGLASVKNELNNFQNDTFNQTEAAPKRASATLAERIDSETNSLNDALAEFKTLSDQYKSLSSPNYEAAYNAKRLEAGIPGIENDYLNVRKDRRELPYTERAASGNAGVMTERQLNEQTYQKDIPLEAREANLLDRLKLAENFVNNSLKFKEMDANTARESLANAINLVSQAVNMSRSGLSDLRAERDADRTRSDAAMEFAMTNNINTPAFVIGTQAYDSRTLDPISLEQYQKLTGQQVGLKESETNFGPALLTRIEGGKQEEKALVMDLMAKYPDAGIASSDSFVVASSKLKNSRIYQEATRIPASRSSGGSAGTSAPTSTSKAKVREWILANKQANPDVAYYDLWGMLVDDMVDEGLNPSNYDDVFWEILHPDGTDGYKREQAKKTSSGRTR